MVDDITCGGAFMDGFFYGYGSPWTYDRWDGATVQIDPETKLIQRKYASVLLLSQPSMVEYVQRMEKRNAVVIANGTAITRTIGKLPIIVDQECVSGPNVHLAQTPCALGNSTTIRNETDVYADVLDKLKWGNLYFYYGEGTLTYPSLPQQQFPITVEKLHEGVITGRERIVTMQPGVYGWPGNRDLHMTYRYSKVGIPIPPEFVTTVDNDGVRTQVTLEQDESAVVKRLPVELQCASPVNVMVTRYEGERISLQANGRGKATLIARNGEFAIAAGAEYTVSVNTIERKMKADKDGVLRVPLTLNGPASVSIWKY
jgi:membrane-bound inhibitor of C-type lysozyme